MFLLGSSVNRDILAFSVQALARRVILEASPPSSQAAFSQLSEIETANEPKDGRPACFQPIVIKFCSHSELFTGSVHPLYMVIIMKPSKGVVSVERCRAC